MTLELSPGMTLMLDGRLYTVDEQLTFHDDDFRLDLVHITGTTAAHERWLLSVLHEPYLMLMQRLAQEWLAPPRTSVVHDGEIFAAIYAGAAYRLRQGRASRAKDGRIEYAIFRANSGRVILTMGHNDNIDAWIGATMPAEYIKLPRGSFTR